MEELWLDGSWKREEGVTAIPDGKERNGEAGIEGKTTEVLEIPLIFSYRDDALHLLIDSIKIDNREVPIVSFPLGIIYWIYE